jgi:hypothetical protein
MHGLTGGDWKRAANAEPRQSPTLLNGHVNCGDSVPGGGTPPASQSRGQFGYWAYFMAYLTTKYAH